MGTITIRRMSNRNDCFINSLGRLQFLRHYVTGSLVPNARRKYCPALARIPRLLVECEEIKSFYSSRLCRVLDGGTQRLTNTATPKLRADKYSAEPWRQVFVPFEIVHAQRCSSEKLPICMCNPCNRQLISIHVRVEFFDPSVRRFLAKNGIPLLKEPLCQLRDVLWIINQVADLNAAHVDACSIY